MTKISADSMLHENSLGKLPFRASSVYLLKARFQAILKPAVRLLAGLGLTANQVTILGCVFSAAFGVWMATSPESQLPFLILPPALVFRMALNAMDGMLARDYSQKSSLGVFLNELGDVISDVFLYIPFTALPVFDQRWMAFVVLLAVISEMAGVVAVMAGGGRRYDGPMGKSDRAVAFGGLALWLGVGRSLAPWAAYCFPRLVCLLLIATVVNRVRNGVEKEIVHG